MSQIQKRYILRLIGGCIIFAIGCILCLLTPQEFDILEGASFFSEPSLLHILWLIWVADMILQIIPIKNKLPLGSFDYVFLADPYGRFPCGITCGAGRGCMAGLGSVHYDVSGTFLGQI